MYRPNMFGKQKYADPSLVISFLIEANKKLQEEKDKLQAEQGLLEEELDTMRTVFSDTVDARLEEEKARRFDFEVRLETMFVDKMSSVLKRLEKIENLGIGPDCGSFLDLAATDAKVKKPATGLSRE